MNNLLSKKQIEETEYFLPDFDKINPITQVIPVAVQNIETKEVILIAYTNQLAINESLKTGIATFWSTSRNELWVKGATSGQYFDLVEAYVNCEQNSLVYMVKPQAEGICHTKNKAGMHRNCFYRRLNMSTMKLENLNP
jgi:phosphoribosyl-AMP cyclohydrolase